jgi:hypothetical protein
MYRFYFDSSLTTNMALEQAICIHARGAKNRSGIALKSAALASQAF